MFVESAPYLIDPVKLAAHLGEPVTSSCLAPQTVYVVGTAANPVGDIPRHTKRLLLRWNSKFHDSAVAVDIVPEQQCLHVLSSTTMRPEKTL